MRQEGPGLPAAQHAGSDYQVARPPPDRFDERRHLFRMVAEVSIQEDHDVRPIHLDIVETAQAGGAVAQARLLEQRGAAGSGDARRPVRAGIVHHDDLLDEILRNGVQHARQGR